MVSTVMVWTSGQQSLVSNVRIANRLSQPRLFLYIISYLAGSVNKVSRHRKGIKVSHTMVSAVMVLTSGQQSLVSNVRIANRLSQPRLFLYKISYLAGSVNRVSRHRKGIKVSHTMVSAVIVLTSGQQSLVSNVRIANRLSQPRLFLYIISYLAGSVNKVSRHRKGIKVSHTMVSAVMVLTSGQQILVSNVRIANRLSQPRLFLYIISYLAGSVNKVSRHRNGIKLSHTTVSAVIVS